MYEMKDGDMIAHQTQSRRSEVDSLFLFIFYYYTIMFIFRYMISDDNDGPLVSMDVKDFILTIGSRSPTPGGGSVAALLASLVSISSMSPTPGGGVVAAL